MPPSSTLLPLSRILSFFLSFFFVGLAQDDEELVTDLMLQVDTCLQYGEHEEPREVDLMDRLAGEDDDDDNNNGSSGLFA